RPFERRVTDDRVINPHGGHDAPEKRHDSAVSPRGRESKKELYGTVLEKGARKKIAGRFWYKKGFESA
ncbi:MAG: hypothetical protein KH321_11150, partial [Clostridium sp.]|nr:hypothetical protein [Clostridium sp.]